MIFEVIFGSSFWCSVLGSNLCTGYIDQSIPVDWLNLIKFEWMVDSVVSEVQWLFDSVCQRFQWLFNSVCHTFQWLIDLVVVDSEIDDWVSVISEIDDWVSVIGWCR